MIAPFGSLYAEHYDLFYQHKIYEAECGFLEAVFQRFANRPVRSKWRSAPQRSSLELRFKRRLLFHLRRM